MLFLCFSDFVYILVVGSEGRRAEHRDTLLLPDTSSLTPTVPSKRAAVRLSRAQPTV